MGRRADRRLCGHAEVNRHWMGHRFGTARDNRSSWNACAPLPTEPSTPWFHHCLRVGTWSLGLEPTPKA